VKIILVHNTYQLQGGEDVVFEQERKLLQEHGHEVLTYQRSNFEADSYGGVKRLALIGNTIWSRQSKKSFATLLANERPDLVHIHNTFMMISPSIYSACREAGVPVVQTLHNYRLLCPNASFFRAGRVCEECTEHSLLRSVRYGCYRLSRPATATVAMMLATHRWLGTWNRDITTYIVLTEFARQKFVEKGLPAEKIVVKPNFVHPDPGPRVGDGEYAVFAGRLSLEKGVRTLVGALKLLPEPIPVVLIGDGNQRKWLEAEVRTAGLSQVTFRGQLSREETLKTMSNARFLIHAGELYEAFCVTIAEAFAHGLPVVCSRLGAMQEVVEDGRTGLHFNPGDARDLADKMRWMWNNRESAARFGQAARTEYERKYTAEKNYPKLMDIYKRALTETESCRSSRVQVEISQSVNVQSANRSATSE
jgi:glycosyltransferase involved in cell wall biosynthesis